MKNEKIVFPKSHIIVNDHRKGESIEEKMRRVEESKEPIKDGAPLIYTERKLGVMPAYNPRTDRWEIALEAQDFANRSWIAERDNSLKPAEETPQAQEGEEV